MFIFAFLLVINNIIAIAKVLPNGTKKGQNQSNNPQF